MAHGTDSIIQNNVAAERGYRARARHNSLDSLLLSGFPFLPRPFVKHYWKHKQLVNQSSHATPAQRTGQRGVNFGQQAFGYCIARESITVVMLFILKKTHFGAFKDEWLCQFLFSREFENGTKVIGDCSLISLGQFALNLAAVNTNREQVASTSARHWGHHGRKNYYEIMLLCT